MLNPNFLFKSNRQAVLSHTRQLVSRHSNIVSDQGESYSGCGILRISCDREPMAISFSCFTMVEDPVQGIQGYNSIYGLSWNILRGWGWANIIWIVWYIRAINERKNKIQYKRSLISLPTQSLQQHPIKLQVIMNLVFKKVKHRQDHLSNSVLLDPTDFYIVF